MSTHSDVNITYISEETWIDWDKTCSKFRKYFEKQNNLKKERENQQKYSKPVYRDSHSVRY